MFSSGQSGIVFSPLYSRFVEPWRKVQDVPVWGGETVRTLVLKPRP